MCLNAEWIPGARSAKDISYPFPVSKQVCPKPLIRAVLWTVHIQMAKLGVGGTLSKSS